MISTEIDFRAAQSAFARDGRCRVDPFLAPEVADRLFATLSTETEFDVVCVLLKNMVVLTLICCRHATPNWRLKRAN